MAVDLPRDCGDGIPRRRCDQNIMKARQPELRAVPQFDSERWKVRLEFVPISADKQSDESSDSSIAVGLTMLSPLVFLIAAYLWALVVG